VQPFGQALRVTELVALIVIGPKELPRVMLQVGQAAAKMRRMPAEFRSQFMDAMREAEIDDIKSDVERLKESAKADTGIFLRYDELGCFVCRANFVACSGQRIILRADSSPGPAAIMNMVPMPSFSPLR
jgi:Sec-independent protein translocase protein TatA